MTTFADRIDQVLRDRRSLLCVGLDPDPALMAIDDVARFNREIVDATVDLVCAYKLQLAFYEALGLRGMAALAETVSHIRSVAPGLLIIGDGKRGDIGSTAAAYARAMYEAWDFDAATVNVYQGFDAVEPFLAYGDRGVFIVCRTSNPSSRDFQDREFASGDGARPLYALIAEAAEQWNASGNVGLVVGATFPADVRALRAQHPALPFLVPALGQQGGLPSIAAAAVTGRGGGAIVSASRSVLYASRSAATFATAARSEAERLRAGIRESIRSRVSANA